MQRIILAIILLGVSLGSLYFFTRESPPPPGSETPPLLPAATPVATPPPPSSPAPAPPLSRTPPPAPLPRELPVVEKPAPLVLDFTHPVFERRRDGKILKRDVAERARTLHDPAEEDLTQDPGTVAGLVDAYRTVFRENPIAGTNTEVVAALTGQNDYDLLFIDPDHPAINAAGELLDRWGTPYRFHPVSSTLPLEVTSAGPDLQFGTPDDIMSESAADAAWRLPPGSQDDETD